jgi:hypothetical protein
MDILGFHRITVTEKRLKLRNPSQDEQRLLLFWEVAQPLARLLAQLPETSQGVRMTIRGSTPWRVCGTPPARPNY